MKNEKKKRKEFQKMTKNIWAGCLKEASMSEW